MNKILNRLKEDFLNYFNQSDDNNLILWFDPDKQWIEFVKQLKGEFKIISLEEEKSLFKIKYLLEMNPDFSGQKKKIIYLNIEKNEDQFLEEYHFISLIFKEDLFLFLENKIGVKFPKEKNTRKEIREGIIALANESLNKPDDFWESKFGIISPFDIFFDNFEEVLIKFLTDPEAQKEILINDKKIDQFFEKIKFDYGFNKKMENINDWALELIAHILFVQLYQDLGKPADYPLKNHLPSEMKFKNCNSILKNMLKHVDNKDIIINYIFKVEKNYGIKNIISKYVNEYDFQNLITTIFPGMDLLIFNKFNEKLGSLKNKEEKIKFFENNLEFLREKSKNLWVREKEIPEWQNLFMGAELYIKIYKSLKEIEKIYSINEILEKYVKDYWEIDYYYRQIQTLPYYKNPERLEPIIDLTSDYYIDFLHSLNSKFSSMFDKINDWSINSSKSINIFSEIFQNNEKKAIFIIDCLRYELGMELSKKFKSDETIEINPFYTEIPSITEIGMTYMLNPSNINIEIQNDEILIFEKDLQIDLSKKLNRENFIKNKYNINSFIGIDAFSKMKIKEIKEKFKNSIIVFHSDIDTIGQDSQIKAFNKFSSIILDIVNMIRKVIESGFEKIYILTDHGFLLVPEKIEEHMKVDISDSEFLIKKQRYAIGTEFPTHGNYCQFNLKNSNLKIIVPFGIACFVSHGNYSFLHGGISIQEIIIPCISIKTKPPTEKKVKVEIVPFNAITNRIFKVQLRRKFSGTLTPEIRNVKVFCEFEGKIISTEPEFLLDKDGEVQVRLLSTNIPKDSEIIIKVQDVTTLEILDWIKVKLDIILTDDF